MGVIFSRVKISVKQVVLLLVFMLVSSTTQMLLPAMISKMIDIGVANSREKLIFGLAAAMIILAVVACLTNIVGTNISAAITTKFSADLRKEVFDKVQGFSASEIDKFGTASLITRNTTDVTTIQTFMSMALRLGLLAPMMAVVGLVLASATAGPTSSVLAVAIPVLLIVSASIIVGASRYSIRLRRKIDDINQLFLETLEGVRVIRAFNKQETEISRFGDVNDETRKVSRKSVTISGMLFPVVQMLFGLTTVGVMGVGSYFVIHGAMEVGALVASTQYINLILLSIILMTYVVSLFPDAYACMKRIAEVLTTEVSIKDYEKDEPEGTCKGTVEFKDVTFAYPGADEPVIKDISFVSKPGETTAIIGRTGCGKSSIVKLIPRLYDTLFGEVLVDGVNVKKYKLDHLREIIGYVPQKNVLFSGDIASNLNFGNENGAEADWKEACRIACAAEFVDKKDGTYHSAIAQGGTNLSGGQRQRMAIARAVMKKPEIYIFDDSFSALDMKTDKQLRQNLKESMGEATMILVAQRVNTIIDATRIIVLDNGECVGMGTHKELLKSCTLYREIAEIQLGAEEVQRELGETGGAA
ncbi:MAG: ABC transporter ATP-binding protein/permease [Lachnospiraceae bacterium]|nr:ABC transporter ATP-binding protein/permease [Lachnospiraceae bacterium]